MVYGLNPRRLSVYFTVRFKALDSRRKHLACESLHTFPGRPKVHYVVIFGNVDEERRTALGWHFRYCSWILYRRRVVVALVSLLGRIRHLRLHAVHGGT